jgi:hypothetical protein
VVFFSFWSPGPELNYAVSFFESAGERQSITNLQWTALAVAGRLLGSQYLQGLAICSLEILRTREMRLSGRVEFRVVLHSFNFNQVSGGADALFGYES